MRHHMNRLTHAMAGAALASSIAVLSGVQGAAIAPAQAARTLTSAMPAKTVNRQMQPLSEGTRRGLRLDARENEGIAWWPDAVFGDCTIDVDLRGKDVLQQSFLGVAFHGVDEKTFDDVYFRPFNFKAADPARKSHAVQY